MDAAQIETSLKSGYSITITFTESGSAYIRAGSVFRSFDALHAAMRLAQSTAPEGGAYDKTDFQFATADGKITYRGRYNLKRDETVDVVAWMLSHVNYVCDERRDGVHVFPIDHRITACTVKLAICLLKRLESEQRAAALRAEADYHRKTADLLRAAYQDLAAEAAAKTAGGVKTPGGNA